MGSCRIVFVFVSRGQGLNVSSIVVWRIQVFMVGGRLVEFVQEVVFVLGWERGESLEVVLVRGRQYDERRNEEAISLLQQRVQVGFILGERLIREVGDSRWRICGEVCSGLVLIDCQVRGYRRIWFEFILCFFLLVFKI